MEELADARLWRQASAARQDEIVRELLTGQERFTLAYARHYGDTDPIRIVTLRDSRTGVAFNLIPGGTFLMGFSEEEREAMRTLKLNHDEQYLATAFLDGGLSAPVHEVSIAPFLLARFPLMATQVASFYGEDSEDWICSEWDIDIAFFLEREDAEKFLARADYRVPSEAEWEYACRAGTTTLFHWGNKVPHWKNPPWVEAFADDLHESPFVNRFGLVNMGAHEELCADRFHDDYAGAPTDGSAWMEDGNPETPVVRGGAAMTHPWQGVGEWMSLLSADHSLKLCDFGMNVRPAISLSRFLEKP
jgi:formylglycine-generating enzyme required for sulfatase activity